MTRPTYDETQLAAVLIICQRCDRPYYMTVPHPICSRCQQQMKKEKKTLTRVDRL